MIIDYWWLTVYYLSVITEEMSTFLGMLLNKKKKEENQPFNAGEICDLLSIFTWQNKHFVDLGMVFKQVLNI